VNLGRKVTLKTKLKQKAEVPALVEVFLFPERLFGRSQQGYTAAETRAALFCLARFFCLHSWWPAGVVLQLDAETSVCQ